MELIIHILEIMKIIENKELMKLIVLTNFKKLNELITNSNKKDFDWKLIEWIEIMKKIRKLIDLDNYYLFQLIILPNN